MTKIKQIRFSTDRNMALGTSTKTSPELTKCLRGFLKPKGGENFVKKIFKTVGLFNGNQASCALPIDP